MINVEGFRIGNLFSIRNCVCELTEISYCGEIRANFQGNKRHFVLTNEIFPLTLLPQHLKSLGFEVYENTKNEFILPALQDVNCYLKYVNANNKSSFVFCFREIEISRKISYVHELQNLIFALKGIELEYSAKPKI